MRASSIASLAIPMALLGACGRPTVHVNGVMRQSAEMRPLPNVPLGGYQQLRVFAHAGSDEPAAKYGSPDCGFTVLEGSDEASDLRNAACVPVEALNTTIRLVRQRLRSYGITVVRDPSDPHDYDVQVWVSGVAPARADRTLAKAQARVAFRLHEDAAGGTLVSGIDHAAADAAFASVSKDCALPEASFSGFASSSRQPMTPDFDVVALASDAVDNLLRCEDLGRFFLDARTRFPKTGGSGPTSAPSARPPQPL